MIRKKMVALLAISLWILLSLTATAGTQEKFSLAPTTATSLQLPPNTSATVQYQVTNHTKLTRTLTLVPISGVIQHSGNPGECNNPFTLMPNKSCFLTLNMNSNQLPTAGIHGGPQVCKTKSPGDNTPDPFLCSQPAPLNILNINVVHQLGHLEFRQNNIPISSLKLMQGDNGAITLFNSGINNISNLNVLIPVEWSSYFNNNCKAVLAANTGCTISYSIPTLPIVGHKLFQVTGLLADNSPLLFPVVISRNGIAKCWGANFFGQLGVGDDQDRDLPTLVISQQLYSDMAGGEAHTCALLSTGAAQCWGDNTFGQLGDNSINSTNTPVNVVGLSNDLLSISAGDAHSCVLRTNGTAACWGSNAQGQLGDGTGQDSLIPVNVSNFTQGISISAGGAHTCALVAGGQIQCWGSNGFGQLGTGNLISHFSPVNSLVSNAIAVSAGELYTCALLQTGTVQCWGDNQFGQLGDGTNIDQDSPVDVIGLNNVIAISAGAIHTCALLSSGEVRCWGFNGDGQLGNNSNNDSSIPVAVIGLQNAIAVVAGEGQTCAQLQNGDAMCWGSNAFGQLGNGMLGQDSPVPVQVNSGALGTALALFNHDLCNHNCAITLP